MTKPHKPALNAPCYSNPEGMTHSFENDVNGKMINVLRTYSLDRAKMAQYAPELLEALSEILTTPNSPEAQDMAHAAITKARGA